MTHVPAIPGLRPELVAMIGTVAPVITVGELVNRYVSERVVLRQRPRTQVENRRHLEQHWRPIHDIPAHQVNRLIVSACANKLAKDNGPVAANRARAALSAMFTWAVGSGLADFNPVPAG